MAQAVPVGGVEIGHFIVGPTEQRGTGRDVRRVGVPHADGIETGETWTALQGVTGVLRSKSHLGFAAHGTRHVGVRKHLPEVGVVVGDPAGAITKVPLEHGIGRCVGAAVYEIQRLWRAGLGKTAQGDLDRGTGALLHGQRAGHHATCSGFRERYRVGCHCCRVGMAYGLRRDQSGTAVDRGAVTPVHGKWADGGGRAQHKGEVVT